ncbi:MAG: putative 2-aminoethylphosphonate ABC transporter permease subunit [Fusobacteriaceae bacterium]
MQLIKNSLFSEKIRDAIGYFIIAVFLVTLIFPLIYLGIRALSNNGGNFVGFQNFREYLLNPLVWKSFFNTVKISTVTTIITLAIGFIYAYGISRCNIWGKKILKLIILLPLFAPTMLHGISLIYLFGRKGIITTGFFGRYPFLEMDISLYGPVGIIISEVIYALPQVYLILAMSLRNSDYRLYEAGKTLGSSNFKQFYTITVPSIKYALISSTIVTFILSFTDLGAPKVVGGNYNVLATDIYKQVIGQQELGKGAVVSILLLIPAIISFFLQRKIQKQERGVFNAKSMAYKVEKNSVRDILFGIFCHGISLLIILIFLTAFLASFFKMWPYDFSFVLDNYKFFDYNGGALTFYSNSIKIALLTGVLGTVLAFFSSYICTKVNNLKIVREAIGFFAIIPLALPGMVLGLGYIFFFNLPTLKLPFLGEIPNPFNGIYGTLWILVFVNIVHFFSVAFITASTALKKLDKEFEIVSLSMGVPWYKTFFKVTLPLTVEAVGEIFVYYFINAMTTVSAAIFLYTSRTTLASIAMINLDEVGDQSKAAAMGVLIILTNLTLKLIYELIIKKKKGAKK